MSVLHGDQIDLVLTDEVLLQLVRVLDGVDPDSEMLRELTQCVAFFCLVVNEVVNRRNQFVSHEHRIQTTRRLLGYRIVEANVKVRRVTWRMPQDRSQLGRFRGRCS